MAFQDNVSVADLAYAAGVIDSDGCVTLGRRRTSAGNLTYAISVQMTNIEDLVPLWFADKFGGSVRRHVPSKARFTPVYKWSLHCRKAAAFLGAILPHLKLKRYRAELAIQLAHMARPHGLKGWNGGKFRHGYHPMTEVEIQGRAELAKKIRAENHRTNARVAMVSKPFEVN